MTNPNDALRLIRRQIAELPAYERHLATEAENTIREIVEHAGPAGRLALAAIGAELQAERLRQTAIAGPN